jgi:hypothetical protein
MFLKHKYKLGVFERIKARLVAGGDYVSRLDAGETASPTVNPTTIMMMINIAAVEDMEISAHDIKGAFLLTEVDPNEPEMFIRLDREVASVLCDVKPNMAEYRDNKGHLYMKLRKYLYGLPQASHRFNKFMDHRLKLMGFKPLAGDPCAYTRGKGDTKVNIGIHVDDLLVCGRREARLKFLSQLSKETFEYTSQDGDRISYLGMTIQKTDKGYKVSQEDYRKELLTRFAEDINQYQGEGGAPAGDALFTKIDKDPPTDRIHYLGMVMSTLYLARLTRADILFPTVYLATKSQAPTNGDYQKLCRVLKYVKKSGDFGVTFLKESGITATIYTDASHGLHNDGKGQVGVIMTLGSGYVQARTSKIKMITLSSTESEQVALCEATTYARWARKMLLDLGYEMKTPTKLYMDNKSAIWLTENMGSFARNKHIMIRRNYTLEGIADKVVRPVHKEGIAMPSDVLTKVKVGSGLARDMAGAGMTKL